MLDLNHGSGAKIAPRTISDEINDILDAGIMRKRAAEPKRNYLGASRLGDPCSRRLCYEYAGVDVDPGKELTPKMLRIFAMGHALEETAIGSFDPDAVTDTFKTAALQFFADAGFKLLTRNSKGEQFGFSVLGGKIQGHIDAAIIESPLPIIPTPCGWEHKGLNLKAWNKVKKHGIKIANEVYFGQLQTYMGYMDLSHFVFTATNKNTSEMHHELVEFSSSRAQALSDRGVEVIRAVESGHLLDRCANHSDFFVCKMCSYSERCWKVDV